MAERSTLPAWFYRLSERAQRCYLRSEAIASYDFTPGPATIERTRAAVVALSGGSLGTINAACQALADEICRELGVGLVRVEIRGARPRDSRRELHGIFYPNARPPRLIVWMRTAQRREVVRPKTFLRTLAHELGHYLDYALLKLGDSFHTRGFFQRESFLARRLFAALESEEGPRAG
ncbi:MAG TPA: hypothetical protein VKV28_06400 [Candidatus Binataceae bacterium]|nr:hypothetical protein [Candidatus Binataceae bacterium]